MAENYITKNIVVTINGTTVQLDEPLYLYQRDKNIDVYFLIRNFKYDFAKGTQEEVNVVEKTNASYATIRVLKPEIYATKIGEDGKPLGEDGRKFVSDEPIPVVDGKVLFTVTETFIDEVEEIGNYQLQISLWDENQGGKITIPPIPFEVLKPIFPDEYVGDFTPGQIDITKIGMSRIVNDDYVISGNNDNEISVMALREDSGLEEWKYGQIISATRMNAITSNLNDIWTELKELGKSIDINASNVKYDNALYPTVSKALDKLLYIKLAISNFSVKLDETYSNNIIWELGKTFNSPITINWSYNKTMEEITNQTLTLPKSGVISNLEKSLTYTCNDTINGNDNYSFKITATDGKETTSKTITLIHYNKVYWGTSSSTAFNNTFIATLKNSTLSNNIKRIINVTATSNEYIYYAFPTRLGTPVFKVGGFEGGFNKVSTIYFTNSYNYVEKYDIYKSTNAGLGNTTVDIS